MDKLKHSERSLNQLNSYIYFAKTGFYTDSRCKPFRRYMKKYLTSKKGLFSSFYFIFIVFIIVILGCNRINPINSKIQDTELIDFREKIIETPNDFICDTCLLALDLKSDTLIIQVVTTSNCQESTGNIKVSKDTLYLYSGTKPDKVETKIQYNEQTNKADTIITATFSVGPGPTHCMKILTYKIIKQKETPSFHRFNDNVMYLCSDRRSFIVKVDDTINIIDRLGLKQGLWIDYYTNGQIKSKDNYVNGKIRIGYKFDENGDTISIRRDECAYCMSW